MPIGYSAEPQNLFDRFVRYIFTRLSRFSAGADLVPPPEALEGYRRAQRLAYDTVQYVADKLHPGMTEREAAELLESYLKEHGSERYLHRPFAWFGNHARFDEYEQYDDYHPSDRKLKTNDTAILDVSPILDGYIGDVGYTVCLEENR